MVQWDWEVDVVVVGPKVLFMSARGFLLALFSYCSAVAVNSVVATWLTLPLAALQHDDPLPSPATRFKPPLSSYAVVYTRDIFNSEKAPVQMARTEATAGNGGLRLLGTAIREHERAFAIIEDQRTRAQGLYREGETISPGIILVQVGWDHVIIERNSQRETLTLPTEPPAAPTPSVVAATTTPSVRQEQDGIRQITQDSFQVDRREVDRALANLNDLFTQVRAIPYAANNGVTQGFRLSSIKPQSLIDRLGLKNGDILQRVNGVEVSDPSTAFSLLQDLQGQSQLRVDVLRNQQPVTLSYEIHQ